MVFMLSYVLNTALSFIFVKIVGNLVPDFLMVFISVTFAIVFFNAINYKSMLGIYSNFFKKNFKLFFFLNLYAFVVWVLSFFIPIFYSPSVFLMTMFAVLAILGNISVYLNNKANKFLIYVNILIIANLIYLFVLYAHELTSFLHFILFAIGGIAAGIFGHFYIKTSHQIGTDIKLKSTQVLAVRFWMLWICSLILVLFYREIGFADVTYLPKILFISVITLLLPIYFLQRAIEKIGANKTGIYTGLVPITIVIMEIIVFHQLPEFIFPAIFHGIIIFSVEFAKKK